MRSFLKTQAGLIAALLLAPAYAFGDTYQAEGMALNDHGAQVIRADSHAPIGVMGDHIHKKGEWMVSYRYMQMAMRGNRIGQREVTPEFIATHVANRFGRPPRLRVVPVAMTMKMHMLGAMYAPTDWLTLMVMGMYLENTMDHITFRGMAGATRLGAFTTQSRGIGDTKVAGLIKLYDAGIHHLHLNAGLSLPTGSNTERATVLTPMNRMANLRLPYPMQLGSGTYDLLPGVTYSATLNRFNWGAQYMGVFRTGRDQGYRLGNKQQLTAWFSYQWRPWLSTSTRLSYQQQGRIRGMDPNIKVPVQTANPDNHGGHNIRLHFGLNLAGQSGHLRGHRLAFEVGIPLRRDLNGPQMQTGLTLTAGWQYAF